MVTNFTTTEWIILVAAVALIVVALVGLARARAQRMRRLELRERFGPEYEREVELQGSVARAERELLARQKRVRKQPLHALSESDRVQFSSDWRAIQGRFVDDPKEAVQAADDLIKSVMHARGYEIEDFDQRVSDLTVEHAAVVQHYRAAHELAEANREGRANTEELRQAVVHYRALFADLLAQAPVPDGRLERVHV